MPEMSWPIPGDKLFGTDAEWRYNACLGWGCDKWNLYATGYKEAADILVDRIVETRDGMDTLVYPVLFLYRHYLELRLKELVMHARQLLGMPDLKLRHHRIDALWRECRPLLEQVWPNDSKEVLETVGACIVEFHQIDANSQGFRYPFTNPVANIEGRKEVHPTLPGAQQINLPHLKEVIERIASFLEGASSGISAYRESDRQ